MVPSTFWPWIWVVTLVSVVVLRITLPVTCLRSSLPSILQWRKWKWYISFSYPMWMIYYIIVLSVLCVQVDLVKMIPDWYMQQHQRISAMISPIDWQGIAISQTIREDCSSSLLPSFQKPYHKSWAIDRRNTFGRWYIRHIYHPVPSLPHIKMTHLQANNSYSSSFSLSFYLDLRKQGSWSKEW